jgi:hypothetical protein
MPSCGSYMTVLQKALVGTLNGVGPEYRSPGARGERIDSERCGTDEVDSSKEPARSVLRFSCRTCDR